jgi:hypothetical protein
VLYLYSEYLGDADSPIHAAAIRSRADWIHGLIDPTANGKDQADGRRLIQMYRNLGLRLSTINNPLEAGILSLSQRMRSGHLKVFASLSRYLEERRLYRRDEKDQIVKQGDDLQDAARCLVNGIPRMRTKPQPVAHTPSSTYFGERSWMA